MSTPSATETQTTNFSPWLHGIEGLGKNSRGDVYWRGMHVERFNFSPDHPEDEAKAARDLAQRCMRLEEAGLPVNSVTALYASEYLDMANTPPNGKDWALAWLITECYVYAEHPQGAAVLHFWTAPAGVNSVDQKVLSSWHFAADGGQPELVLGNFADPVRDVGLGRFYECQSDGYVTKERQEDAAQLVRWLNARGVSPQDLLAVSRQAQQAYDEHLEQQRRALVPRCTP